jgi:hypothetical protein
VGGRIAWRAEGAVSARRWRDFRPVTGWSAVLALLLLMVMPLGMLHRSSNGGCRQPAGASLVDDGRLLVRHGIPAAVLQTAHEHRATEPPIAASVPGGCGPAVLDAREVPSGTRRPAEDPAEWRRSAPALLAAPPPAPPPRLS